MTYFLEYCCGACLHVQKVCEHSIKAVDWQMQVDQKGAEKTLDAETEQLKVGLHAVLMGCCTV